MVFVGFLGGDIYLVGSRVYMKGYGGGFWVEIFIRVLFLGLIMVC